MEQKREIERKRAAQQEELRRQEQAQQQEAERQRERERLAAAQDPRKLAQRQAIEKRRLENGKKEQQKQASQQEMPQLASTNRHELGGPRPPSRLHGIHEYARPANQPPGGAVRPSAKRIFEPEIDEEATGPAHVQSGSLYQQMDAKRRRTDDEEFLEVAVRPTMLPPKRQSNARKVGDWQSIDRIQVDISRMPQSNLFLAPDIPHHIRLHIVINRHHYLKPRLSTRHINNTSSTQASCLEPVSHTRWLNTPMEKYRLLKPPILLQNHPYVPGQRPLRCPNPLLNTSTGKTLS